MPSLCRESADDRIQTAPELEELLEGCLAHVQRPTVHELPARALKLDQLSMLSSNAGVFTASSISRPIVAGVALLAFVAAIVFSLNRARAGFA
ncbi:MAG: hypothetical protein U0930_18280 [Pirellulales bacterium]